MSKRKKKSIHDQPLSENEPSFPHPNSREYDFINTKQPFAAGGLGIDTRKSPTPSLSGKSMGQALIDWEEETNFDE